MLDALAEVLHEKSLFSTIRLAFYIPESKEFFLTNKLLLSTSEDPSTMQHDAVWYTNVSIIIFQVLEIVLDSVPQFLSNALWSFQKILSTNFFKKITQGTLWFFKINFKVIQDHRTHLNERLFKLVIFFLKVMFTVFIIGNSDLHACPVFSPLPFLSFMAVNLTHFIQ